MSKNNNGEDNSYFYVFTLFKRQMYVKIMLYFYHGSKNEWVKKVVYIFRFAM